MVTEACHLPVAIRTLKGLKIPIHLLKNATQKGLMVAYQLCFFHFSFVVFIALSKALCKHDIYLSSGVILPKSHTQTLLLMLLLLLLLFFPVNIQNKLQMLLCNQKD